MQSPLKVFLTVFKQLRLDIVVCPSSGYKTRSFETSLLWLLSYFSLCTFRGSSDLPHALGVVGFFQHFKLEVILFLGIGPALLSVAQHLVSP